MSPFSFDVEKEKGLAAADRVDLLSPSPFDFFASVTGAGAGAGASNLGVELLDSEGLVDPPNANPPVIGAGAGVEALGVPKTNPPGFEAVSSFFSSDFLAAESPLNENPPVFALSPAGAGVAAEVPNVKPPVVAGAGADTEVPPNTKPAEPVVAPEDGKSNLDSLGLPLGTGRLGD